MAFKNKYLILSTLGLSIVGFLLVFFFDSSSTSVSQAPIKMSKTAPSRKPASTDKDIMRKAAKGDPSVKAQLISWSVSKNVDERGKAALFLWRFEDAESVKALGKLAMDPEQSVRIKAYGALSLVKDPKGNIALSDALKNDKLTKQEKNLINLQMSRGQNKEGIDAHISEALSYLSVKSLEAPTPLNRTIAKALSSIPKGKEKLKEMFEKEDPKKITAANAPMIAVYMTYSCASNRYEYFKSALDLVKDPKEKMRIMAELKIHGVKGAELISAHLSNDPKLPENFTKSMSAYVSKKRYKDICAKK